MIKKTLTVILIFILFSSFFNIFFSIPCRAAGDTLHVGTGQTYSTIQEAINAANTSDTVYVHTGTYSENIVINKSITLKGESNQDTIIQGSGGKTIQITANNVEIKNLKIKNNGGETYNIYIESISDCLIKNNILRDAGWNIYLQSSSENNIEDNSIKDNDIGIYLSNADNNIIKSNNINSNSIYGIDIPSSYSSDNTIYLNDFSNNNQNA
ncbi:MAG: right-handed parallel beta-helix repeat-containing protein, partial [Candidatus Thermoplasmatota archaeon]